VVNWAGVREFPSTYSISKGLLRPSEKARFIGSAPGCYFVEFQNSPKRYASKGWTELVAEGPPEGVSLPSAAPAANSTEGNLLISCSGDLKADVLVVGHPGKTTSSRDVFLDAVGAKTFIVSSGPTKYGSVTLPDPVSITPETALRWQSACGGAQPSEHGSHLLCPGEFRDTEVTDVHETTVVRSLSVGPPSWCRGFE
jgi:hypothetical protein